MKQLLLIFNLLFSIQTLFGQNLVETYYRSGFNNSGTLELFDDNTFIQKSIAHSCTIFDDTLGISTNEIKGTYKIEGKYLSLQPRSESYKPYNEKIPTVLKNGIRDYGYFVSDYFMMEYKEVKYLLAHRNVDLSSIPFIEMGRYNGLITTANRLNARDTKGRMWGASWLNKNSNYWREEKNYEKSMGSLESIRSHFPKLYKDYVLTKPIVSEVILVREVSFSDVGKEATPQWKKHLITFNKGKKDGVRPEMIFYPEGNSDSHCRVIIKNVFDDRCEGYVSDYGNQHNCLDSKNYSTKEWIEDSEKLKR